MHPTDEDSTRVFEDLVNAYYRPLYQFAYSLVRGEAEASDLTQQTFYCWARKGHTLRDRSKAKTWLFTTLYREFLKSRRHEMVFPHDPLDPVNDTLPDPSASTVEQLDSAAVHGALATLEEIYRTPLELFYVGEHSYKEISNILSVPIGTVQSRIFRGKAQLREALTRVGRSDDVKAQVKRG
jgi:RNA polymerase sigma factor (sigma-70 family)